MHVISPLCEHGIVNYMTAACNSSYSNKLVDEQARLCARCLHCYTLSFPASIKSKWLIPLLCLWTLLSPCIKTSPPQRVSATGPHIKHVTTPHHMYVPVCCPGDRWQIEMKAGRSCTLFKCYSTSTWIQIPPMLTSRWHAEASRRLFQAYEVFYE